MNAAHIVASIADEATGPAYSVTRLAEAICRQGVRSRVLSVATDHEVGRPLPTGQKASGCEAAAFVQNFATVPVLRRLALSRALNAAINRSAAEGAVLHSHGLWLMPNVYPGWAARRYGVPLVVAPRGMLGAAALAFSRRKKQAFWALLQRSALAYATCYHATSEQEVEDIRAYGLKAPVAVVPNGIDIPPEPPRPTDGGATHRTVLHLGRIHPKKGIDRLLHAWQRVAGNHSDWRLRIVGPSELGHVQQLEALARELGLSNVGFDGPLFGAEKLAAYREAELFVLPTLHENFGMVVAESLAAGTPVICTKGAPWGGLDTHGCGWWIDHGAEPLAAALDNAMRHDREVLAAFGARGRDWMARHYSWAGTAADMLDVYNWCNGNGDRPSTIVVD